MNSLVMIALCSAAIGAPDGESYTEAHQATMKTGKPMLVMVSTDWCPACQVMKRRIIPQIRERGLLSRVAFATVNPDQEGELSHQLIGNGLIPELVMYRKTPRGWIRRVLVGGQSVERVEQFINQGTVADDDLPKDAEATEKAKPAPEPKPAEKTQKQPSASSRIGLGHWGQLRRSSWTSRTHWLRCRTLNSIRSAQSSPRGPTTGNGGLRERTCRGAMIAWSTSPLDGNGRQLAGSARQTGRGRKPNSGVAKHAGRGAPLETNLSKPIAPAARSRAFPVPARPKSLTPPAPMPARDRRSASRPRRRSSSSDRRWTGVGHRERAGADQRAAAVAVRAAEHQPAAAIQCQALAQAAVADVAAQRQHSAGTDDQVVPQQDGVATACVPLVTVKAAGLLPPVPAKVSPQCRSLAGAGSRHWGC